MAKRKIDTSIMQCAQNYAEEVKKHYDVKEIILFGSYAKGLQHEGSDIDIAIVTNDIRNRFDDELDLMRLRREIDVRIEPHAIRTEEFLKRETSLINEVINTGIKIYSAQ